MLRTLTPFRASAVEPAPGSFDGLSAARGLWNGLVLGAAVWAVVAWAVWG